MVIELSKASGVDGFNLNLVRKLWGTIGAKFTGTFLRFLAEGRSPRNANLTWVI